MKKLFEMKLAIIARAILQKYRPKIIGVTGSVGKSSTKEAIIAVLGEQFHVRGSHKNYNNELGVPLSIIGADAPWRSPIAWLGVFFKGLWLLLVRTHYPEVLVIEMGADHPGDIAYLTKLAPPHIGVVTAVASVHTEFFKDLEGVRKEKFVLAQSVPQEGTVILSADDELVRSMAGEVRSNVIAYGFREEAEVRAVEYGLHFDASQSIADAGTVFKISYGGAVVPMVLRGVFGRQHVYAALAAASVGLSLGMNLVTVGAGLQKYQPLAGRMRILGGVKQTVLIDDTYNASPRAAIEALEALRTLVLPESARRVMVLGDMLELGSYAEEGHREVGMRAAEIGIDLFVSVGELARHSAHAAQEAGLSAEQVFEFGMRDEAGRFLQDRIRKGDVILIKGSQGARMEYLVKELMAEPLRAEELLVRQDASWKK